MEARWIVWCVFLVIWLLAEWGISREAKKEAGQAMPVGDLAFLGCGVFGIMLLLFLALAFWLL